MEISNNYSTAKVWNTSNKNVSKSSKKNKWKLEIHNFTGVYRTS